MKKYKALLFDADQTLLDFKRSEAVAFRQTALHCCGKYTDKLLQIYSQANKEAWLLLEKGEITKERLMTYRFESFFDRAELSDDPSKWNNYYKTQLANTGFVLDGAIEVLEYAKEHYALYLVTNGIATVQYSRLENSGIGKYFDHVFVSEEIGAEKPSRLYFDHVFKNIECTPEQALIIGDSLTSDISGGVSYGLDTCFINWNNIPVDLPVTYCVSTLSELLMLLKNLGQSPESTS